MHDQALKQGHRSRRLGILAAGLMVVALTRPALAVDGVIEINQSKALAGGVTAGDFPNYPITLSVSGSYRLTSDLTAAGNNGGIVVAADNVTLDLNGFTLYGVAGIGSDGIGIGDRKNVEIKNGTVRGFSRSGVFSNVNTQYIRVIGLRAIGNTIDGIDLQGQGNLIDGCTSLNNGASGIRVFEGSLVTNSISRGNTAWGLALIGPSGYRSNVLTANNGGDANPQVSGGFQLGTNVCGNDLVCP